jgi:glycerate 2-kinase
VLTSRKLTGQFPNYEAVLPRDNNKFVIVRSEDLMSSIQRVAQFADERSGAIKIRLEQNELKLSASSTDAGEAKTSSRRPTTTTPSSSASTASTSSTSSRPPARPARCASSSRTRNPPARCAPKTPIEDVKYRYILNAHAHLTVLAALKEVTPRTAVLFLLSGGASAMMEQPLDPRTTLQDMAAYHRALVGSGLPITAMNAMRKHLSAVKGGRLAVAAAAAHAQVTLLLSDVPNAAPDAIGSGPSLPDTSTLSECRTLLNQLNAGGSLPSAIVDFFSSPLCTETPGPDDPAFARSWWRVILSGEHLAAAASNAAQAAGYHVVIDNTCDEWEYREAARYLLDRSSQIARQHQRTCLISVGELGVALPPNPGEGGRNQQFALWSAAELARRGQAAVVLSAGSDGIDGNSAAAGAVCDQQTVQRAAQLGLSVEDALAAFDTAPLLHALDSQIVAGPTGNNLRDLRLILTNGDHGNIN